MHVPSLVVINLYFDIINLPNQGRSDEKNMVLYDLSFHLLLENDSKKNLDTEYLRNEFRMDLNSRNVFKRLNSLIRMDGTAVLQGRFMVCRKSTSQLELYNTISKLIRDKCKKYSLTDVRVLPTKVVELIDRYVNFLGRMTCSQCNRTLHLSPQGIEYPLLNHGNDDSWIQLSIFHF